MMWEIRVADIVIKRFEYSVNMTIAMNQKTSKTQCVLNSCNIKAEIIYYK